MPCRVETMSGLHEVGIKIGSTSGYTRQMMDVVIPAAARKGYVVDNCVTSDNLPAGRPFPYMIFENMRQLGISCCQNVVKVGDTVADIKEGISAGVWSIGVIMDSNELALTQEEVASMECDKLEELKAQVRFRMLKAGAHYVIDSITELPGIIEIINQR